MKNWTTRDKALAVIALFLHAVIVFNLYEVDQMTPRNVVVHVDVACPKLGGVST